MHISLRWLQEQLDIKENLAGLDMEKLERYMHRYTGMTAEVEGWERRGDKLEKLVVGEIVSIDKHPNADKLSVCDVKTVGRGAETIVCGGSNLKLGAKVVVVLPGGQLWDEKENKPIQIKTTAIRGVESQGMICAAEEIGLDVKHPESDGARPILVLADDAPVGEDAKEYLGLDDFLFEIDNKSLTHRADLWSVRGHAREWGYMVDSQLSELSHDSFEELPEIDPSQFQVQIDCDQNLFSGYAGLVIEGLEVKDSPDWLKTRLSYIGSRAINNLVDITNYVMWEMGVPQHSFDFGKLAGSTDQGVLQIIGAKSGEKITTLDNQSRELPENALIGKNAEGKVVDLMGIMGGAESETDNQTHKIFLWSAVFEPKNIRRTSGAMNLRTDASSMYEKGLDINLVEPAVMRAWELIKESCPNAKIVGRLSEKLVESYQAEIEIKHGQLETQIGIKLDDDFVGDALRKIGFEVENYGEKYHVVVPWWRKDVSEAADVVEEVARLYGYDEIEPVMPEVSMQPLPWKPILQKSRHMKQAAAKVGFQEVYNYSFIGEKELGLGLAPNESLIKIMNPLSKDLTHLRPTTWYHLLEKVQRNAYERELFHLFELGKCFSHGDDGDHEDLHLGMSSFAKSSDEDIYYVLKGKVEALVQSLGVQTELKFQLAEAGKPHTKMFVSGKAAMIMLGDDFLGIIGEVAGWVTEAYDVEGKVALAEFKAEVLAKHMDDLKLYDQLVEYPPVKLDISFVADEALKHADVEAAMKSVDPLVFKVELFDVFVDTEKLGEGKKSMAYRVYYRSPEKTLEVKEVQGVEGKVIKVLEEKFGVEVRR